MSKTPLIHIGMPKCASTWLQKHYFNEQHGYHQLYGPLGAHLAFVSARPFDWAPPENMGLEEDASHVPVITAESLVGSPLSGGDNGETILNRLQQTLPQAKVLIVIREQRAMLRSIYKLLINWGSPYSLEMLLQDNLIGNIPHFNRAFLNFDRIINAYQTAFGKEQVLVLALEQFQQEPHRFLQSIGSFCDVDAESFPISADTEQRENLNRTIASLEFKRLYNRFIAKTRFNINGVHRPKKIQGAANLDLVLPTRIRLWQESKFTEKLEALVGDYYEQSNARSQLLTGLPLDALGYRTPSEQSPTDKSSSAG